MHDDPTSLSDTKRLDPLRRAAPPGRWQLIHGPMAERLIEIAKATGQPVAAAPPDLAPMPPGFPAQAKETQGAWLLEAGGQRYYLRSEAQNRYVSCYLYTMPAP